MELLKKTVFGIILTFLIVSIPTLVFNTVPVRSDPKTITVPDDYSTIQEAINNASEGDTIFVRNGTYYENVVLNKTVYLAGESRENTIVDGQRIGDIITVTANNVNIIGFTLQNSGPEGSGVLITGYSSHCNISYNVIQNTKFGVKTDINNPPTSINNTIKGNSIFSFQYGIYISSDNSVVIDNNISLSSGGGIHLFYSKDSVIIGNNISRCDVAAIYLSYCRNNTIATNSINDIRWSGVGIRLDYSYNNVVLMNNITAARDMGIRLEGANNNVIMHNSILGHWEGGAGIIMSDSHYNLISNNIILLIATQGLGFGLQRSCNNILSENICKMSISSTLTGGLYMNDYSDRNIIMKNTICTFYRGVQIRNSWYNSIFHNNFVNNSQMDITTDSQNTWDKGYPIGGNYWSDYDGMDLYNGPFQNETGCDGIGDAPYVIDSYNRDSYPLMAPINIFDVGIWNDEPREVHVVSNSTTILNFQLNAIEKIMSFNVTGIEGTAGFCRVTIPNIIVEVLWNGNYTVLIDGKRVETRNWTDVENTYICFTYEHSEHKVAILQTYTTTLQIETTTGGTTDPPPDLYSYVVGDIVSVLAIPDLNYKFEYWILDVVNVGSQNPIEILMDSNHTLQAIFAQITYHQLTITSTGGGTTDPAPGTYTYVNGTVVSVMALPDVGYSFGYWRLEGEVRTVNPIIILVAADGTLEAFFVDDVPPDIGSPVQDHSEDVEPYQNVTVTVSVTDLGTGVYNVTLWYSIDNGTSWTPLNMTEISTNTYQATIPGYENCTWITYKIAAYDNAGKPAVKDNNGYHYKYHVIPEFTSTTILLMLMLTTLITTILLKKKRKTKPQLP